MEIALIKENLIKSCLAQNSSLFIESLMSPIVIVNCPNKTRFYRFFKHMVNCTKCNSIGILNLKIEHPDWDKFKYTHYNFYDDIHRYPRLTVMVKEVGEYLYLDVPPF